jgi:hypothetical protein
VSAEERSNEIANRILFSAFQFLLPELSERVSAIRDIVAAISDARLGYWDRRDLSRWLESSADKLAKRLTSFDRAEFVGLPDNEKTASALGVCGAVDSLRLTKAEVIENDASAEKVYRLLLPEARRQWHDALVSSDAIGYGEVFLREASKFLVAIVRDLPEFTKDVAIANLTIARQIHALLDGGIDSVFLPRYRRGTPDEIVTFDAIYRSDIVLRNKDVEIFGLSVPAPELRRQPLEMAYIGLSVSSEGIYSERISRDIKAAEAQKSRTSRNVVAHVEEALGLIAQRTDKENKGFVAARRTGSRVLITGNAGSGKTTLTQWLTVRTAEQSHEEPLISWNSRLPILAKLRALFPPDSERDPTDQDLLDFSSPVAQEAPGDWLATRLSKDALVILDGLDELSEYQRSRARNWMNSFFRRHQSLDIVITSRPDAIDRRWFSDHGFTRLDLQPMALSDIRKCVSSWFEAARSTVEVGSQDDLTQHQRRIMNDIEQGGYIQELAEMPLVCAMLCAFYAYSDLSDAPASRGELYQQVIDMLIDKRERARQTIPSHLRRFLLRDKLDVLQAIARYCTENHLTELPKSDSGGGKRGESVSESVLPAVAIVNRVIRGITRLSITAADAMEYLLERSAIWREISPGVTQFAHRSFQEFLTGRAVARSGSVTDLLAHLGSDEWNRIVAFAAGQLDEPKATRLVGAIFDKSRERGADQRGLLLLAAECLSGASVEPDMADRASEMLRVILPPSGLQEAELIGRSGEGVVRFLSGYDEDPDEVVAACLRAAAVAGGPAGLDVIVGYSDRVRSPELVQELIANWQYFDAELYAREVLSGIDFDENAVRLTGPETLRAAKYLRKVKRIVIDSRTGVVDFGWWKDLEYLYELDCAEYHRMDSTAGLKSLPRLRRLKLTGRREIRDFSEVGELSNLEWLFLDSCTGLSDGRVIDRLGLLSVLSLNKCANLSDLDWLGSLVNLKTLSLNGCHGTSISFCRNLPKLQTLRAGLVEGVSDFLPVSACDDLWRLEISLSQGRAQPMNLPPLKRLRSLTLRGSVTVADLASISGCDSISKLVAHHVVGLVDLSVISAFKNLRTLRLIDCPELVSVAGLWDLEHLTVLDLQGSAISFLNIPARHAGISVINLDRCFRITRMSEMEILVSIPGLRKLVLPPVDVSVLRHLERLAFKVGNSELVIECEPIPSYETG